MMAENNPALQEAIKTKKCTDKNLFITIVRKNSSFIVKDHEGNIYGKYTTEKEAYNKYCRLCGE